MTPRSKAEVQADVEASRLQIVKMQQELAELEEQAAQKGDDIKAAEAQLADLERELESAS